MAKRQFRKLTRLLSPDKVREHIWMIVEKCNDEFQRGKFNNTFEVTLAANATSTVLANPIFSPDSEVFIVPKTASARASFSSGRVVAEVTLDTGTTSTTVANAAITASSRFGLTPRSATAARWGSLDDGIWVGAPSAGQVDINHDSSSDADRTFDLAIFNDASLGQIYAEVSAGQVEIFHDSDPATDRTFGLAVFG